MQRFGGVGKVVDREAPQLQPRMIDLDPDDQVSITEMVDELLHPDDETHIAYRYERRQVARLERTGIADSRLTLPDDSPWIMLPDESGDIERQRVEAAANTAFSVKRGFVWLSMLWASTSAT